MSVVAQPLTWDDIKDWPVDAGQRTELVHGELVVSPSPTSDHQIIVNNLIVELNHHVLGQSLGQVIPGPIDVVFRRDLVYVPDLCFVSKHRLNIIGPQYIEGPPDLCVEVISESNRTHDTVVKYQHYARYGVAEYWLVDTREAEISTWKNQGGEFSLIGRARSGQFVTSAVLPELRLNAVRIFTRFVANRIAG
jgi:Uma2 family endonuclease